jgi:hypothetical protein
MPACVGLLYEANGDCQPGYGESATVNTRAWQRAFEHKAGSGLAPKCVGAGPMRLGRVKDLTAQLSPTPAAQACLSLPAGRAIAELVTSKQAPYNKCLNRLVVLGHSCRPTDSETLLDRQNQAGRSASLKRESNDPPVACHTTLLCPRDTDYRLETMTVRREMRWIRLELQ